MSSRLNDVTAVNPESSTSDSPSKCRHTSTPSPVVSLEPPLCIPQSVKPAVPPHYHAIAQYGTFGPVFAAPPELLRHKFILRTDDRAEAWWAALRNERSSS